MQSIVVSYLRFVGFSIAALALAACAKLAPTELAAMGRPEPRFGEPPQSSQSTHATPVTEAERITLLEAQINELDGQLAHLRKALDVMGPLPEHRDMFIPIAKSEIVGETGEIAVDDEMDAKAARLARLYALAPKLTGAASLFYEAELGSFPSRAAAETGWNRLAAGNRMAALQPRYAAVGAQTRLLAGPLASEAAVDALCVELLALAGQCRVAAPIRAY